MQNAREIEAQETVTTKLMQKNTTLHYLQALLLGLRFLVILIFW